MKLEMRHDFTRQRGLSTLLCMSRVRPSVNANNNEFVGRNRKSCSNFQTTCACDDVCVCDDDDVATRSANWFPLRSNRFAIGPVENR